MMFLKKTAYAVLALFFTAACACMFGFHADFVHGDAAFYPCDGASVSARMNPNGAEGVTFVSAGKISDKSLFFEDNGSSAVMYSEDMGEGYAVALGFSPIKAEDYHKTAISFITANYSDAEFTLGIFASGARDFSADKAAVTVIAPAPAGTVKEFYIERPSTFFADENGNISDITFAILSCEGNMHQLWFNYIKAFNVEEEAEEYPLTELQFVGLNAGNSDATHLYMQTDGKTGIRKPDWDGRFGGNWVDFPNDSLRDQILLNGKPLSFYGNASNVPCSMGGTEDLIYIGYRFSKGDVVTVPVNTSLVYGEGLGFVFVNQAKFEYDGAAWAMTAADTKKVKLLSYNGSDFQRIIIKSDKPLNVNEVGGEFLDYVTLNGRKLSGTEARVSITAADTLEITGIFLGEHDRLVIRKNAAYIGDGYKGFRFAEKVVFTVENGVLTARAESGSPTGGDTYVMPEGMLSDCTPESLDFYQDGKYLLAVRSSDKSGFWTDNQEAKLNNAFLTREQSPEGAESGTFRWGWNTLTGLCYPATCLHFTQKVPFDPSAALTMRIWVSGEINGDGTLWITNCASAHVYDTAKQFPLGNLPKDQWTTVSVNVKDIVDPDGEITDIFFTVYYPAIYLYADVAGADIYFDTFYFERLERTVREDYSVTDISAIVPMDDGGVSFTGNGNGNGEEFNFDNYENVAFIRTDVSAAAVKTRFSVNNVSNFEIYFVMLGRDVYFNKGGIYYWFNKAGVSIGTATSPRRDAAYPEKIKPNEEYVIELGAVPYYVNMIRAGYYAYLKIDGQTLLSEFYDISEANFGNYFGTYLHSTASDTTLTLKAVELSSQKPIELTLSALTNVRELKVGDFVKLTSKLKGNFYGQSDVEYVLVSGFDSADIDAYGYLEALSAGTVTVKARVRNTLGTFESEEVTFTVSGEAKGASGKKGCGSAAGAGSLFFAVFAAAAVLSSRNKKKNQEGTNT